MVADFTQNLQNSHNTVYVFYTGRGFQSPSVNPVAFGKTPNKSYGSWPPFLFFFLKILFIHLTERERERESAQHGDWQADSEGEGEADSP